MGVKFWTVVGTICNVYIVINIIFAILHEGGYSTPFNFSHSLLITVCQIICIILYFIGWQIFAINVDKNE